MKAVILAAGKGTRMGDLTSELPKPMLVVRGKPVLEHIIAGLISSGIRAICLVTGYRADVIRSHFGDGAAFGAEFTYAQQIEQTGTGKAPEAAKEFTGSDPFLLTYGDVLVKPETYSRMLQRFQQDELAGVVTVTRGQDVTKGAIMFFDERFCLRRLAEKPSAEQLAEFKSEGLIRPGDPVWYNAGIYIFHPSLFEFTARLGKSPRGEYELTDALSAMASAGNLIAGLEIEGRWVDVRDPDVLASLQQDQSL